MTAWARSPDGRAWLLLAALVVVWGCHWTVAKIGLETIPPFTYAMLRLLVAMAVLAALMRGAGRLRPTGSGGCAHRRLLRPAGHRRRHRHHEPGPALRGSRAGLDPGLHAAALGRAHRGRRRAHPAHATRADGPRPRPDRPGPAPQPGRHRLVVATGAAGLRAAARGCHGRGGRARPRARASLAGHALRRPDLAAAGGPGAHRRPRRSSWSATSGPPSTGTWARCWSSSTAARWPRPSPSGPASPSCGPSAPRPRASATWPCPVAGIITGVLVLGEPVGPLDILGLLVTSAGIVVVLRAPRRASAGRAVTGAASLPTRGGRGPRAGGRAARWGRPAGPGQRPPLRRHGRYPDSTPTIRGGHA